MSFTRRVIGDSLTLEQQQRVRIHTI
jgi:hypothetical protein